MIYFDNAATSLIKPISVKNSIIKAINDYTANPGRSGHEYSYKVAEKIFNVRDIVKNFFNASNYSLIFTKNCTEALNLAIQGTLKKGDHVITTCYEHNSVLRTLFSLTDVEKTVLDCELNEVDKFLKDYIKTNTKMVITTMVSNVTGEVVNSIAVGKICKQNNLLYLVDGAQACGHMEIDLSLCNIDMLAFAGHKGLLSITGVGGLLVKDISQLRPIMFGGTGTYSESLTQPTENEEGFEAGTISTIPIISLGAGIDFLNKNFKNIVKKEQKLSKYLYLCLKKLNFLTIYSNLTSQSVFSFNIKNMDSSEVANILNEKYKIAVRAGLHCAPLIHKKLNTTKIGAVRVSLDFNNTFNEIDYLISALKKIGAN